MEKRAIITILICIVLFFLWVEVISPRIWPPVPAEMPAQSPPQGNQPPEGEKPKPPIETPKETPKETPNIEASRHPAETKTLECGRLVVKFTTRGGGVESLHVKSNGDKLVPLLDIVEPDRTNFALRVPQAGVDLAQVHWVCDPEKIQKDKIVFEYSVPKQWSISKTFTLDEKKYVLSLYLEFKSLDGQPHEIKPEILPFNGIQHDSDYRYEEYCQGFVGMRKSDGWSVDTVSTKDVIKAPKSFTEPRRDWMGLKNRYFAVVFMPEGDRDLKATEEFRFHTLDWETYYHGQRQKRNITTSVPMRSFVVKDQVETYQFSAYLGPIRPEELKQVPRGLTGLYDPSGLDFLAVFILWILNFGFTLFRNHGVAILVTTIVIRLMLFPLSKKSQVSMFRIQQLGPKLAILRERYKDDRERFGQEQMKLFREQKINPMSGCLPMLLQLPIFIGMYGVLDSAFDLRQSPFAAWIKDLSMPDHLAGPWKPVELLFFSLDALNLLPIIMTITWFLQSFFAPRSTDPQMQAQQKMMMFMPIFFGIMCYNLASGLSFYFFVNSLLSMAETKLIKKFFLPKDGQEKKAK